MNFERDHILRPILDDLGTNDQNIFWSLHQKILGEATTRNTAISSPTVALIFQAFQNELNAKIVPEGGRSVRW
jgi:hypothetical protein